MGFEIKMKCKHFLTVVSLMLLPFVIQAQSGEIIFEDNFKDYQNGSPGAPNWIITKGVWTVSDGGFIQQAETYDCGALLDIYLNRSFKLEFKFRALKGEPGAGFFFHSEKKNSTAFSHMCRIESEQTMLKGLFKNNQYECREIIRFEEKNFKKWHRMSLIVDQDKGQYSVSLDGKTLIEGNPFVFKAGYCGLQSSGGMIEFDDVKLSKMPMKKSPPVLDWIHHFIVNQKKQIVIPHQSKAVNYILNPDGKLIKTFGTPVQYKGQFECPVGIVELSNGSYVVSDTSLGRVFLFNKKGKCEKAIGYAGTTRLKNPLDLSVDENDHVYIVDRGERQIFILDNELEFIASFGKNELKAPLAVNVDKNRIYVLDSGYNQIVVYGWQYQKVIRERCFDIKTGWFRDLLVNNDWCYVAVNNEVRKYANDGRLAESFNGESIGGIYPTGLGIDAEERIYIADFLNGRILIVNNELAEPEWRVLTSSENHLEIEIYTPENENVAFKFYSKDQLVEQRSSEQKTRHVFKIDRLLPSTTYHFQFTPEISQMPAKHEFSKKYPVVTAAEAGKKHFRSVSMATIIFTEVLDTSKMESGYPELPPLEHKEIDRIKNQIRDGVKFYWMNSHLNFFIDNDFIVVRDCYFKHELFGPEWWYPPLEKMVEKTIRNDDKRVDDYQAVLYLACVRNYDEKKEKFVLGGRGGGFTMGLAANGQYGISYWEVTHKNHNSGNNWLMVHEFHHQLDELFMLSGYPEYWFCHFSPSINTAADFGEHFDGNAWILKNWDQNKWYDLKYGDLRFTDDQDMDGIPDDDPSLPMDEKRLGSSDQFVDYDADGVSDLDEINFSNWVVEGCGETYGGAQYFPNLSNPDTDNDGLIDGQDLYPLYPAHPEIHFGSPWPDSVALFTREHTFARLTDYRIHANVFAQWDSSYLKFAFETDRLAPIKLMVDADADGWFIGRDNLLINLIPEKDGHLDCSVEVFNAAVADRWPFHDEKLAKQIDVKSELKIIDDRYFIEVRIPKQDYLGLKLAANEKIGVSIGFKVTMDAEGYQRYVTIFEPNRFFDVQLVD